MPRTNLSMSISADGYVAGPDQSEEHPLGVGGQLLHSWHLGPASDHPVNKQIVGEMMDGMGATIMGRNMFGPIRGDWNGSEWNGWWGVEPPYHCPVFVLTHYPRESVELEGTTFISSPTGSSLRTRRQWRLRAIGRSASPAERRALARPSVPASSTRSIYK